jgi:ABC-type branched-subunit amino acid transport system permease subunit
MILLGGLTTLHGPIIGALAYVGVLREVASLWLPERTLLVEGAAILTIVLLLPRGLTGLSLRGFRQKSTPEKAPGDG